MPGPLIAKPQIPAWADPQGASVFDVPGQGLLRKVVGLLGLDDPNQVMAFGTPLEVGANTGGVLDALAQRFPRFANAIKAYHGSPHDFEKFDTSKIGTGEGAQAYGHGLYFAENPEVAAEYRKALSPASVKTVEGQPYDAANPSHLAVSLIDTYTRAGNADPKATVIKELTHDIGNQSLTEESRSVYRKALDLLHNNEPLPNLARKEGGKTYEVAIKAHPDQFLDWDKPFSKQSPDVQRGIVKAMQTQGLPLDEQGMPLWLKSGDRTGESIHATLSSAGQSNSEGQAIGTARLKDAGVAGIKYLDQGSRPRAPIIDNKPFSQFEAANATEAWAMDAVRRTSSVSDALDYLKDRAGSESAQQWLQANAHRITEPKVTRNYVVFDDATVEILRKYGILPPVVGATLAGQQANQQPQP